MKLADRTQPLAGLVMCLAMLGAAANGIAESHYWALGAGSYGAGAGAADTWCGFTELDKARLGWVYLTFGNPPGPGPETTAMLNRFLDMNPRLKIMVRVWPIGNLGAKDNRYQATFLDYLYKPGVKEKLLAETSRQIGSVMDGISRPENVLGFTFLEELPFHFAGRDLDVSDPDKRPPGVELYKEQIEAELGKDFRWELRAKMWWGRKFTQALNEINAHIKEVSGGKWVFVYLQTNHDTLDWLAEGEDGSRSNVLPFFWRDVIKPGVADGFFAYPNNDYIWERYLKLARDNDWLFFSQLSQPSGMRLTDWAHAIRLAETDDPRNLGYFFYSSGHDATGGWNDDPSIDPEDNFHRASIRSHYRQHMAKRNVGMDIVKRCLQPEIELAYDFRAVNDVAYAVIALVRNIRDVSWFVDPEDTALRDVKVTLSLPPGMTFGPKHSPPATIVMERLQPGELRKITWWPQGQGPVTVSEQAPVMVTVEAPGVEPVVRRWTGPLSEIAPRERWEFRRSGEGGYHPVVLGRKIEATVVRLECIEAQATRPALQIGNRKAIYLGVVLKGQTLVLGPGRKATLIDPDHPDGRDVTAQLGGNEVMIEPWSLNPFTYTDLDTPAPAPKLRLTLEIR